MRSGSKQWVRLGLVAGMIGVVGVLAHADDGAIFSATVSSGWANSAASLTPAGPSGSTGVSPGENLPSDPNNPPVAEGPTPNGDMKDPSFMVSPAPQFILRGNYMANGDNKGVNNGGGVGVVVFLDAGHGLGVAVEASGGALGGGNGAVGYFDSSAKVRYRVPFDKSHIIWGALGIDASGAVVTGNQRDLRFSNVQAPIALIGTMVPVGSTCMIQLFAKASLAIWDNQTQDNGHAGRPEAGAEMMANCKTIRIQADYQHIFELGAIGDSDKFTASLEQAFPVNADGSIELGYFIKGDYLREGATNDTGSQAQNIYDLTAGFELRYGVIPKVN